MQTGARGRAAKGSRAWICDESNATWLLRRSVIGSRRLWQSAAGERDWSRSGLGLLDWDTYFVLEYVLSTGIRIVRWVWCCGGVCMGRIWNRMRTLGVATWGGAWDGREMYIHPFIHC
jgi:hypothetical protein